MNSVNARNASTSLAVRSDDSAVATLATAENVNHGNRHYIKRPWLDEDVCDGFRTDGKRSTTATTAVATERVPVDSLYFRGPAPSAFGTPPKPEPQPLDLSDTRRKRVVSPSRPVRYPAFCACRDCVAATNAVAKKPPNGVPKRPSNGVSKKVSNAVSPNRVSKTTSNANSHNDKDQNPTPYRTMANARERIRARAIKEAFETLKKSLPKPSCDQNLSKLKTIVMATDHIKRLTEEVNNRRFSGNHQSPSEEDIWRITLKSCSNISLQNIKQRE